MAFRRAIMHRSSTRSPWEKQPLIKSFELWRYINWARRGVLKGWPIKVQSKANARNTEHYSQQSGPHCLLEVKFSNVYVVGHDNEGARESMCPAMILLKVHILFPCWDWSKAHGDFSIHRDGTDVHKVFAKNGNSQEKLHMNSISYIFPLMHKQGLHILKLLWLILSSSYPPQRWHNSRANPE
jgi:hypothetical protein